MKKICVFLFLLVLNTIAFSQSKDQKALEVAIEQLRTAMVDGNKAGLENAAAEDLSYGHSGGKVENKAEYVEKIASGKSNFVNIELTNQTIKIVGNTAIVRHDLAAETNDQGKEPGSIKLHILTVWQKQGGKWKMLARQAIKKS